jgi:hypothetical protein
MQIDNRVKIINLLETILIKEAIETFERKKKNNLSEEEKNEITQNWYIHSSIYTRMWLNYLTDENLEKVLSKKLNEQSIKGGINTLMGRI